MPATTKTRARNKPGSVRPRPATAKVPASLQSPPDTLVGTGRVWAVCALLAVVTLLIYRPVGAHPFVNYDDPDYVVNNSHVQEGMAWATLTWALTATEQSNWHPLTWLSHALDYQLFALDPAGHHWTNVLIHTLNTLLLFLLLWRITGATGRSLLVGALFALHPLNVESVAWIAERKNVLSTLFFLLTLGAYGWYARKPAVPRYLVVALLFVLGLASKPMVVTLPFVLLLLDFWPLQRIKHWTAPSLAFPVPQQQLPRLVLEKLPLLALSLGSAAITVVAQGQSVIPTMALPIGVRLENAAYAYGMYLLKAVWPVHLALIYPHPGRTLPAWLPALATLTILAMSLVAWTRRLKAPYLAVGWLWFLGTAVPVIGIVQVGMQVIADRYAYVPLIGVFVFLVWAAGDLADRLAVPLLPRVAAAAVILGTLSFITVRQIGYWRSSVDVWTHALAVTEDNSVAENALANALFGLGRYPEGMAHLRNYARLEPLDPFAHARVAADYQDGGHISEAIREFEAAIRAEETLKRHNLPGLQPGVLAITHANLAVAYGQSGDAAKARVNIQRALEIDAPAVDQMINQLAHSVSTQPSAQGYLRLGLLLRQTGRKGEAEEAFAQARKLDPRVGSAVSAE